ncbi:hypothetical protein [Priestia aryabhattai]|nr:hypothetical protein [Priestia aryabhattai]
MKNEPLIKPFDQWFVFLGYDERRFYLFRSFWQLIGGQKEDSCRNSGTG